MSAARAFKGIRAFSRNLSRMTESGQVEQLNAAGPVETSIRQKLFAMLQPTSLTVTNDSWQHRHHSAMRAQGSNNGETHFSVKVVSDKFDKKTTMQRHRMIYSALSEEFSQGLHALSLDTKTEAELAARKV